VRGSFQKNAWLQGCGMPFLVQDSGIMLTAANDKRNACETPRNDRGKFLEWTIKLLYI
jgi:hypothetical protein